MAAETVDRETGEIVEAVVGKLDLEGSPFGPVRIPREYVINQQGREFVLSDGLVTGLHQLSRGFFAVETRLEQLPTETNGMLAVCAAKVTVFSPDGERELRVATGIGDASPGSVTRTISPHLVRMAETRAVNRALRLLLNEGAVSFEELGPEEPVQQSATRAVPPTDRIAVGDRMYSREEVAAGYRKRLAQAKEAGLALGQGDLDEATAPLSLLVGASQELRRRLEARGGGAGK